MIILPRHLCPGTFSAVSPTKTLISQLIMIGISEYPLSKQTTDFLKQTPIGGVVLVGHTYKNSTYVKETIQKLRKIHSTHHKNTYFFIAIDQEGGRVQRIRTGLEEHPSAETLGNANSLYLTHHTAQKIGLELKALDIDINFAPVMDVNTNDKNTVIGTRSYGKSPKLVQSHGLAFMNGLLSVGIVPVIKHFPGHGSTTKDSHKAFPIVKRSKVHLEDVDITPFNFGIQNNVPAIMTAHVTYTQLDPDYPATLSKIIITQLLREDIGFKGVVFSDDLMMKGISDKYSMAEASLMFWQAGGDFALIVAPVLTVKTVIQNKAIINYFSKNKLKMQAIQQKIHSITSNK